MKQYTYNLNGISMWASFDYGEVEAENWEEAVLKAKAKIQEDFDRVNLALEHCDNTLGMRVDFDPAQLELTEKK